MRSFFRLPLALLACLIASPANAAEPYGEITLLVMPAYPVKMNWKSPRSLLTSALAATAFNGALAIGHISVEVRCGMRPGAPLNAAFDPSFHIMTSAVPTADDPSTDMLLKEGAGFAILESSWAGAIETPSEVQGSIDLVNGKPKRFSQVTFLVSENSCQRALAYFREYSTFADRTFYGNSPRPLRKEGSGCSAYGVSFLEVAGVMTKELRADWAVSVRVPLSLMAGYLGVKNVSFFDIYTKRAGARWAKPSEPNMLLETFEPRLMHDWVLGLANSPQKLSSQKGKLRTRLSHGIHGITAIEIDRRNVPTPEGPIFEGEPALVRNSNRTVIRADKIVAPNGSFELRP